MCQRCSVAVWSDRLRRRTDVEGQNVSFLTQGGTTAAAAHQSCSRPLRGAHGAGAGQYLAIVRSRCAAYAYEPAIPLGAAEPFAGHQVIPDIAPAISTSLNAVDLPVTWDPKSYAATTG